ncbi:MAG: NBR1-Ig-like domain-containing protein [Parcubacteria group bacterium]
MAYKTITRTRTSVIVKMIIIPLTVAGLIVAGTEIKKNEDEKKAVAALMEQIKNKGCIADGVLTGYGGDTASTIALLERSQCAYLHRSIETWTAPPNFSLIANNLSLMHGKYIQGMFLAEAIGVNSRYFYPAENRMFDFSQMCLAGSQGFWGEGTCKANMSSKEYQKYILFVTRQAIDLGIQSFMFGQVNFQDPDRDAPKIMDKMKDYARSKGKTIVIGAQTNDIDNAKYLKAFDYIEGGSGINNKGEIQEGPCLEGLWGGGSCWALLWNKKYSSKANNVLLHLDWSGLPYDDMSRFARMKPEVRAKTLKSLYQSFSAKKMGFLMPFFAVLYDKNNGCYGPSQGFYSPDRKYSCNDEAIINNIFNEGGQADDAQFVKETVPSYMVVGRKYAVSITLKNSGNSAWTKEKQFRFGSQNPQDNDLWGKRINLDEGEAVLPGQEKTFTFSVTAPKNPGIYNFQWQMVEELKQWFGEKSENVPIAVVEEGNKNLP